MIVVGPPFQAYRGRVTLSILLSTLPGSVGHEELYRFTLRLGLRYEHIVHFRRPRAHITVIQSWVSEALALGAVSVGEALIRAALRR